MKNRNIKLFILLGMFMCANAPHEENQHHNGEPTYTPQHTTSHSNEPTDETTTVAIAAAATTATNATPGAVDEIANDQQEIERHEINKSQVYKELPWYWRNEWLLLAAPIVACGFAIAQLAIVIENFDKKYCYAFSASSASASLFAMFQYIACARSHAKDYKSIDAKEYINDRLQTIHKYLVFGILWYLGDLFPSVGQIINTWDNFDKNNQTFKGASYCLLLFIFTLKPYLLGILANPNLKFS